MDNLYSTLFNSKKDITINNVTYEYIGKGGQGVVFKMNEFAIKIIPKEKYQEKEYKIGLYLNNLLNGVSINFVKVYDKIECDNFIIIKMDYISGKFVDWMYKKHDDKEYINMILQILINLRILQNKINLYHRDMKPKNILYKDLDTNVNFTYELNDNKYTINTNIIFYITDFGHSISDITDDNLITNSKYITYDSDLYELSMLPQRIKVDRLLKDYKFDELYKVAYKNEHFKGYYENEKKKIDDKMKTYPEFIKQKHLTRNIAYFILENNLLNVDISNIMSENIEKILNSLLDNDIDNIINKIYELYITVYCENKNCI
jgi:serine/threonine protein kinase